MGNGSVVLFLHGGGWIAGSTKAYWPLVEKMVQAMPNVPIVSADYALVCFE